MVTSLHPITRHNIVEVYVDTTHYVVSVVSMVEEYKELTFDPSQSSSAGDAESGEVIGHLLLIGLIAALHSPLVQSVVIVEDELEDVPEEAGMEELCLEPRVNREGRAGLDRHAV